MFQPENATWFVLKKNTIEEIYNSYELKEGNIIKLGNVYLKLKKLKLDKENNNKYINKIKYQSFEFLNNNIFETNNDKMDIINDVKEEKSFQKKLDVDLSDTKKYTLKAERKGKELILVNNLKFIKINENKKEKICRICYIEEKQQDDPLIHPCSCMGSMKYIHFKCLKYWLEKNNLKLEEKYEYYLKYTYKEPRCELCKTKYPEIIYHKGKEYNLYDINNQIIEFDNYLILEKLSNEDNKYKTLYKISLDNNDKLIKIGRAKDNDFSILEASISRNHCQLKIKNNRLFLSDWNSKFGSLILIQTPFIQLVEKLHLFLQVGNNFIKCKIYNESNFSLFSCCEVENEAKSFDFYYKQNKIKSKDNNIMEIKAKLIYNNKESEEENAYENNEKTDKIFIPKKILNSRATNKIKNTNNSDTKAENATNQNTIQIIKK